MAQDLAIAFSAISLLLWVMLWLLGTVKSMLPIQKKDLGRSQFVVPALLYGVAVLIGFTVVMFVGFVIVPKGGSFLLANIGIALVVVQAIIIILAPYIVGITTNEFRKVNDRSLMLAHIVGTLWLVWTALMMQLLISSLAAGSAGFSALSLFTTFLISVFVVFLVYMEFMWIMGRRLNGLSKLDESSTQSLPGKHTKSK